MSTRATYRFDAGNHKPGITLYIHHDGYPSGAAGLYMLPAIEKARGHLTPEAFIRANERAELTRGHDAHGDTEYRYTIDIARDTVKVEHRRYEPERWECIWFGSITSFVNQHAQEFRPGVHVKQRHAGCWMTAEMAADAAADQEAQAESYRKRFPQYTGNIASGDMMASQARAFADSFAAVAS